MLELNKIKNTIILGDSLEVLKTLPDESINSIITSPPYFNLRDYGVDGQIGLEKTYQEYIKKLVDVFNEAKRVLKKDGTCFINLGDSYGTISGGMRAGTMGRFISDKAINGQRFEQHKEIKFEKSLMMIPERFAIEMIDNGWILRNKLVWVKPNAMPESVQDRWKKAHEYIFFFVKNKKYYFNLDAIRTQHAEVSIKRAEYEQGRNALGINPSSTGEKYKRDKSFRDGTEKYYSMPSRRVKLNDLGACPPDYLLVNTNCSENDGSNEHYATYPQKLIAPLIKAGSRERDIILDPFMGSGSTAVIARFLSRDFIGIELNQSYIKVANKRLAQKSLF